MGHTSAEGRLGLGLVVERPAECAGIKMNPLNLKIESLDDAKKGGQHVGIGSPGVRVTHIPTGLTASCAVERSQQKNRMVATQMIEWALAVLEISDT
jgi:peptide chain release factor 1